MSPALLVLLGVACVHGTDLRAALHAMEDADAPFVLQTREAVPNLTLRSILEPFANRLEPPFVKFAHGSGEPMARADAPTSVDAVLGKILAPREPLSLVLRFICWTPPSLRRTVPSLMASRRGMTTGIEELR